MGKESFKYEQPFTLENGAVLPEIDIAYHTCLLYTSDAADERSSEDLGGRRII